MNKTYKDESKHTYFVLAGDFGCCGFKYWNNKKHFWEWNPGNATKFMDSNKVKTIKENPAKYQPNYISNSSLRVMRIQVIESSEEILE